MKGSDKHSRRRSESLGLARLRAHVRDCPECSQQEPPVADIASILEDGAEVTVRRDMSAAVLKRAAPDLQRLAARSYRRRVAASVAAALLPLPAVLVYGVYLLRTVHSAAASFLPDELVTYAVGSYAMTLLMLLAMTYAAIPLMIENRANGALNATRAGGPGEVG